MTKPNEKLVEFPRQSARDILTDVLRDGAKGFRRVKGCQDMPALVAALRARDARLGLGESSAMVA